MCLCQFTVFSTLCFVTLSLRDEVHLARNFRRTRLAFAHSGGVATTMRVLLVVGVRVNATLKWPIAAARVLQVCWWEALAQKRILVHVRRHAPSFQASFAICLITDFLHQRLSLGDTI